LQPKQKDEGSFEAYLVDAVQRHLSAIGAYLTLSGTLDAIEQGDLAVR